MKKYLLVALLFVVFLFGPSVVASRLSSANRPIVPPAKPLNADNLWSLIQNWRQSDDCRPGGCQPYIKDQRLCEIAEVRKNDLDGKNDDAFNHDGLYKKYSNYKYVIQENITGANSETEAIYRWLGSKPHAATLRESYKYSCVSTGTNYAVQIFSNME